MTAAKHLDPVVGIDMHLVQMPGPMPPVMLPVPYAGYLLDPSDYSGACTTHVNGLPRARAGTPGIGVPPHIPPGGMFVMPPSNECEMYQGSSTVVIDGDAAAAMGHQVLSCHDAGMPAPVRGWKTAPARSLMLAASVVLPIPAAPVMIGGAPTVTASATTSTRERERPEPILETVTFQVFDGLEMPMCDEPFELHLPNGDIEDGALDAEGSATVRDVLAGYCVLVLPHVERPPPGRPRRAVDPPLSSDKILRQVEGGTELTYVVQRAGVSFRSVCLEHGILNWRAAYLDGANQSLRERRLNPQVMMAGDELRLRLPEVSPFVYRRGGVTLRSGAPRATVRVTIPRRFHFSV